MSYISRLQYFPVKLIEDGYDDDGCQDSLEEPCFHHDRSFRSPSMFEEMMQWRYSKYLPFEIFFREDLQEAGSYIQDEQEEQHEERDQYPHSHIEDIQERTQYSSQRERAAISHEYLGRIDIVKHKGDECRDHDSDHRRGDEGPVEEGDHSQDKQHDHHQSAGQPIQSISDVDGIDDADGDEECDDGIEDPQRNLACERPEIDIVHS